MMSPGAKVAKPRKSSRSSEPCLQRPVKVALVADPPEIRRWIKLINFVPDFTCICACATGEEALLAIPREQPDVVLMDIVLPRMSGIECTVRLKELLPQTPVIIFTAMDHQELVFMALEAGADGYLLKRTKPPDLRTALLDVLRGGAPMTSQIARCVIESFRQMPGFRNESKRLSLREEQILMLLCQGYANSLIAGKLNLSINTVCVHLKHVFQKLQVGSRTEAVIHYLASKTPQQTGRLAGLSHELQLKLTGKRSEPQPDDLQPQFITVELKRNTQSCQEKYHGWRASRLPCSNW
jgi:DNA-binding NarL/FixJ family response regulator